MVELKTDNPEAKAQLDKLAGQKARITGDENGDTIQIASVQRAKNPHGWIHLDVKGADGQVENWAQEASFPLAR